MSLTHQISSMGVLRNMLHILAIIYILLLPFSEPSRVLEGWMLFWGGILPASAPLVFVVLMFDVMMCSILKGEAPPTRQAQLTLIVRTHLVLGLLVLGLWLYSFAEILFG